MSITTQEALNQYIDNDKGASWTDIVTISGVQNGELKNNDAQNRFIEADDLQIENSTVTVDGKGNFIGGDNVNIQNDSTINLNNEGHLLVTREEDPNIVNTLTIAGTVNMNKGIIRAASSNTNPASHGKVVLEESGVINVKGDDNTIASRETIVNGQINVNSGMLDLTGGLTRGDDGILSKEEADKAKEASFTIGKTGALTIAQGATANSNASDIFNNGAITNNGTFNIAGDYNSDGGKYSGGYTQTGGSINLTNGATLNVGIGEEGNKIVNGKIDGKLSAASGEGEQSNLNLIFDEGLSNEDLKEGIEFANSAEGNLALKDNLLYNYDKSELKDGKLSISKKDASTVSADLIKSGVGVNQAGVLAAFTAGQSGLIASNSITHEFSNSLQRGQIQSAAAMAEVLAPMAAPMVRTLETGTMAHAYDAVSSQLSGGTISSAANGKSSGDSAMTGVTTWVQGLYNNSKLDSSSKARGFDSDSAGVAMGIHKAINKDVKAGISYSYTDTDVDAYRRNIDVKSHTFIAYGEYKPSNWFVNGIASYGMSDYDEHKKVFGGVKADYDVKSYGLQAMTGYDACVRGLNVTPQAGLRYAHIKQKSYTDTAGQHISGDDMDILTGIIGVKASRDFALDNGMFIRPEARVAMTYDLMDPDNNTNVALANGATYRINGENFDSFSVEAGAGVTAELNDAWEVSAGYEGKFRDDYKDHSGILSAKYKF